MRGRIGLVASILAGIALAVSMACGGGGGGGGGGPTAPGTPSNPAPPPSPGQLTDTTLFGQLVGFFGTATGFSGATVRVVGEGEDTVGSDDMFHIDSVPPGEHVLVAAGSGFLRRHVRVEMKAGGANQIPTLDLAEDATFNLRAFDEIYREDGEAGTARMVDRPVFLIDKQDFGKLPNGRGEPLMGAVEAAIRGPMTQALAPFFNGVTIRRVANIPEYESPCDLPEGDVNWHAERDLENSEGDPLLGLAWWCFFPEEGIVRGGILTLDDGADTAVILHEMVHLLGSANHLEKANGTSIIQSPVFIPGLSAMDEQHLKFLYRRPPGLLSPDDARQLEVGDLTQLSGALSATGMAMEVRCSIFRDGRAEIERGFPGQLSR